MWQVKLIFYSASTAGREAAGSQVLQLPAWGSAAACDQDLSSYYSGVARSAGSRAADSSGSWDLILAPTWEPAEDCHPRQQSQGFTITGAGSSRLVFGCNVGGNRVCPRLSVRYAPHVSCHRQRTEPKEFGGSSRGEEAGKPGFHLGWQHSLSPSVPDGFRWSRLRQAACVRARMRAPLAQIPGSCCIPNHPPSPRHAGLLQPISPLPKPAHQSLKPPCEGPSHTLIKSPSTQESAQRQSSAPQGIRKSWTRATELRSGTKLPPDLGGLGGKAPSSPETSS